jgi:hypothetical protein
MSKHKPLCANQGGILGFVILHNGRCESCGEQIEDKTK